MNNKFSSYHPTNKNFSDEFKSGNEPSDLKKVDINVLLNRVKNNKVKDKKRNITFIASSILGVFLSAYIIFN